MVDGERRVLGTFAIYFGEPRVPAEHEERLLRDWLRLAGVAIERSRHEQNLKRLAERDALTGIANRKSVMSALELAVAHATPDTPVAALFLDLDRFKVLNDSCGHPTGDAYLRIVASRLLAAVRPLDTVGRLGGDEFLLVARGLSGAADAEVVARRLVEVISAPVMIDGTTHVLSASVGIAVADSPGVSVDSLVTDADAAMYGAKERGRNQVAVFTQDMRVSSLDRLALQAALRSALDDDELRLVYQPKIDLATGALAGYEALLRWRHPSMGDVSPAQFIPVAEDTGMIVE